MNKFEKWGNQLDDECKKLLARARKEGWPYGDIPYSLQYIAENLVLDGRSTAFWLFEHQQWELPENLCQSITDEVTAMLSGGRAAVAKRIWQVNCKHIGHPPFHIYVRYTGQIPSEVDAERIEYLQQTRQALREGLREPEQYSDSGWTFQQVIGSLWINPYSGGISQIGGIFWDRWNKPGLVYAEQEFTNYVEHLGTWRVKGQYQTNAVRIDHLPDAIKQQWIAFSVQKAYEAVEAQRDDEFYRQQLEQVIKTAKALGADDAVLLKAENSAAASSSEPVQMRLF